MVGLARPPAFLVAQISLANVRPFFPGETHQLAAPTWPDAEPGRQFVRSIGGIYPRLRGSPGVWSGESAYCNASGVVRFASAPRDQRMLCRFRRLYGNGNGMLRFELGLSRRPERSRAFDQSVELSSDPDFLIPMLRNVLDLRVRIRLLRGSNPIRLAQIDNPLAAALLQSTSSLSATRNGKLEKWWVTSGRMLVLLQYPESVSSLEMQEAGIAVDQPLRGISLNHLKLWHASRSITVWIMSTTKDASVEEVRTLRIHLFRLHAEREALRQILRLLSQGRLTIQRGTNASDRLQRYLTSAVQLLEKDVKYGIRQAEVLRGLMAMMT
jgi:hypothetical protein